MEKNQDPNELKEPLLPSSQKEKAQSQSPPLFSPSAEEKRRNSREEAKDLHPKVELTELKQSQKKQTSSVQTPPVQSALQLERFNSNKQEFLMTEPAQEVKRNNSRETGNKISNKLNQGNKAGAATANQEGDQKPKSRFVGISIFLYNSLENLLIFLLTLNAMFYPNFVSSIYMLLALILTVFSLTKNQGKIKMKRLISVSLIVIGLASIIAKTFYLLKYKNSTYVFSPEQVAYLKSFSMYIEQNAPYLGHMDMFMTIFFDLNEILLAILIIFVYNSQLKQSKILFDNPIATVLHLNPIFFTFYKVQCGIAMTALLVDVVFIQTFFQLIILISLLLIVGFWAFQKENSPQVRHQIVSLCQVVLVIQLVATFTIQVPIVNYSLGNKQFETFLNMFGLLLHYMQTYSIVIHIIAMCFSIQAIKVYKVSRECAIKYMPFFIHEEEDPVQKEQPLKRQESQGLKRRATLLNRGITQTKRTGDYYKASSSSVSSQIKEKNIIMKKQQEETIQQTATKYYKQFSPYIWLWVCRGVAFLWCYAYHDYQSLLILFWILHSTVFSNTQTFVAITSYFYLPLFILIYLFYFTINIPKVVNFQHMQLQDQELWWDVGFYQFSYPFIDVGCMFIALLPFFFLIHSRKYLFVNEDETKENFLKRLTAKESPTIYYAFFMLFYYLDLLVYITIFFSGVNKIDFYHIFLMFFLVAFVLWPTWFKSKFIIVLIYSDFFVFEKYLYTLVDQYIDPYGFYAGFCAVMGFSTDYNETQKYFRYTPKFQQWFLIIVCFLQYEVYKLLKDQKKVQELMGVAKANFKNKYPRVNHIMQLTMNLIKELLVFIVFIIFFLMVIFAEKNAMNWGYQIIVGIFLIVYMVVSNDAAPRTGLRRLQGIWNFIIYYTAVVLLIIISFQFLALPQITLALNLSDNFIQIPQGIAQMLGLEVYTTKIWEKFLIYMVFFAIGVIVKNQFIAWNKIRQEDEVQRNSDMQSYFGERLNEINWASEFMKVRFTREFLVYKIKPSWFVLDKMASLVFVVINIFVMLLANYWQISFAMFFNLVCFSILCMMIANKLLNLRSLELEKYYVDFTQKVLQREIPLHEVKDKWREYKAISNQTQVKMRESIWFVQFIFVIICLIAIYPSQSLYTFYQIYPNLDYLFNYFIFYSFWGGVYYSPVSGETYWYNVYGYLVILILLIMEKSAQRWGFDRFGCTSDKIKWFHKIEEGLKASVRKTKDSVIEEKPEEEEEDKEEEQTLRKKGQYQIQSLVDDSLHDRSSQQYQFNRVSGEAGRNSDLLDSSKDQSIKMTAFNEPELIEKKILISKWLKRKYKMKTLRGIKVLLEEIIQLFMLISSVYKDNVFSLVYLATIFMYAYSRTTGAMVGVCFIVAIVMMAQYFLVLSNLTSDSNPMAFPYPFQDGYPVPIDSSVNKFLVPWYTNVKFFLENSDWALYFGIGIASKKLNGVWIDYLIMGIIQAYFFYFNCQLFSIDFKMTMGKELKQATEEYCLMVSGTSEEQVLKKEIKKLKNEILTYSIYSRLQTILFMYFHLITIVTTLLLSILSTSLFSFGYIICCLYMVYENPKFLNRNQEGYRLHGLLRFFLRPYVFLDITLQIFFQIPIPWLHDTGSDPNSSWQNIIGFYQIWFISTEPPYTDTVSRQNCIYVLLKTFTYFIVSLQIQIFSSKDYKLKFVQKDLNKYLDQAEIKSRCITYKFNNIKMQKIAKQQQEKKRMDNLLVELKKKLKKWQQIYFDQEEQYKMSLEKKAQPPSTKAISTKTTFIEQNLPEKITEEEQLQNQDHLLTSNIAAGNRPANSLSVKSSMTHKKQVSQMIKEKNVLDQIREEEELELDETVELSRRMKKLNCCARMYIYMKKNYTNQIIFITSQKKLIFVEEELRKGKVSILTKLEQKMLKDIRSLRLKRERSSMVGAAEYNMDGMRNTKKFLRCKNMTARYLGLFLEMLSTHSEYLCYFFMLMSMMVSAGLITLFYPFMVFGYAILEETNPSRKCWYLILIYTMNLIFAMFVYQLQFWEAIISPTELTNIGQTISGIHVGLERLNMGDFKQLFGYFLPEILILFSIMVHIQKEILIGLFDKKETQIENISQAVTRYLLFQEQEEVKVVDSGIEEFEDFSKLDVFHDLKFHRDIKRYDKLKKRSNSICVPNYEEYDYSPVVSESLSFDNQEIKEEPREVEAPKEKKCHSLVDKGELSRIYAMIQERECLEEQAKLTTCQKLQRGTASIFYKNEYFERLFPSIKLQKPGVDFYSLMFGTQFVICLFLIFFFTRMTADVTTSTVTDSTTYNQFSGQMVIALFLQIIVVVLDRYLYKAKTFIAVEEQTLLQEKLEKEKLEKGGDDKLGVSVDHMDSVIEARNSYQLDRSQQFERAQSSDALNQASFYGAMRKQSFQQFIGKQIKEQKDESVDSSQLSELDNQMKSQFDFELTKITFAIVGKFYLQWFLLLFVHSFVFFYFPISGNVKLQGNRYCDKQQEQLGIVKCNEFQMNWSLIVFYLIYCVYFLASALQIKYGVTELRKGNFMMWSFSKVNNYIFQGYMLVPFLFESKTFADWTFTRTALDVFQWFNLSNTHATLFVRKASNISYRNHKLGQAQPLIMKFFIGYCGLLGIIILIAGPLLLFSTFNPISELNLVHNAKIDFNVMIQQSGSEAVNAMNLYSNNFVQQLESVSQELYDDMSFANVSRTKSFTLDEIQFIQMNNNSDTNWDLSIPNQDILRQVFQSLASGDNNTIVRLELQYRFDRQNPPGAQSAYGVILRQITLQDYPEIIYQFNQTLSLNCTANPQATSIVTIPAFYYPAISLSENNKALMLQLNQNYLVGLQLFYSCENYWTLNQYFYGNSYLAPELNNTGLTFFTFSNKIAPSYFKYSLITFYVSIVLVVGKLLRSALAVSANNIFITEMIDTDALLMLCECIYIYRMQNKLEKEEELYYVLMDVMRSPEMIKQITGSSLKKKID